MAPAACHAGALAEAGSTGGARHAPGLNSRFRGITLQSQSAALDNPSGGCEGTRSPPCHMNNLVAGPFPG